MRISLLSAALLANSLAFAATPVDGWYTSVFGGYAYLPPNISNTIYNFYLDDSGYNSGYNAGGRIGFQGGIMRYELEYTYLHDSLKHFSVNNVRQMGVTGYSSASLGMANVYVDFPEMLPAISPYLGMGIGYAHIQARFSSIFRYYPTALVYYPTTFVVNANAFAYQGTAGITYNFAENYAVNLAYRYVATDKASNFRKIFEAHIASAGAIFRFDQANYK